MASSDISYKYVTVYTSNKHTKTYLLWWRILFLNQLASFESWEKISFKVQHLLLVTILTLTNFLHYNLMTNFMWPYSRILIKKIITKELKFWKMVKNWSSVFPIIDVWLKCFPYNNLNIWNTYCPIFHFLKLISRGNVIFLS